MPPPRLRPQKASISPRIFNLQRPLCTTSRRLAPTPSSSSSQLSQTPRTRSGRDSQANIAQIKELLNASKAAEEKERLAQAKEHKLRLARGAAEGQLVRRTVTRAELYKRENAKNEEANKRNTVSWRTGLGAARSPREVFRRSSGPVGARGPSSGMNVVRAGGPMGRGGFRAGGLRMGGRPKGPQRKKKRPKRVRNDDLASDQLGMPELDKGELEYLMGRRVAARQTAVYVPLQNTAQMLKVSTAVVKKDAEVKGSERDAGRYPSVAGVKDGPGDEGVKGLVEKMVRLNSSFGNREEHRFVNRVTRLVRS